MIEIPVYSADGAPSDTLTLDEQLLGGEVRPALLKQAYVMYHANRRQGSAATRGRGEVEGSTRKLYRQKGTGRARRGPVRTNIMRGGGVAFGKHPHSYRQSMPVKQRRLATRNALLAKAVDSEIKVVEDFGLDGVPKTAKLAGLISALGINRTCLLALSPEDRTTLLAARNISDVETIRVDQLNAYDLLSNRFLLVQKSALADWLASQKPTVKAVEEAA